MKEITSGDGRRSNGRKPGTLTTEHSTLAARLRAAMKMTQEDFAREIGTRERTVRRYEKLSIAPKAGDVREALERLAALHGVPVQEP